MATRQVFNSNTEQFETQYMPTINPPDFSAMIEAGNKANIQQTLQNAGILSYDPSNVLSSVFNNQYGNINPQSYATTTNKALGTNTSTGVPTTTSALDAAKIANLNAKTDAQKHFTNMGIANNVFSGLGTTANIGLGIWNAIEQSQNAKKTRELMDKQIANYNEQIEASREARQQRRDELARLSKMRSNTKAQFNTQASVTRSY